MSRVYQWSNLVGSWQFPTFPDSLHLHHYLPIDGKASNTYFYWNYMEMIGHANCCFKLRFIFTTLCQEGEKTSEYRMLLFPMAGNKPGPPAQQLSALSISPLPLAKSFPSLPDRKQPIIFSWNPFSESNVVVQCPADSKVYGCYLHAEKPNSFLPGNDLFLNRAITLCSGVVSQYKKPCIFIPYVA